METKTCSTCNEEKLITEFYSTKKRTQTLCKKCFNSYCVERWIKKKIDSINYKGNKCVDCSLGYPEQPYVIFDFHHLNPLEKDVDWSKLRLKSDESIKKELDKCILLCSNCHRIRHHLNSSPT